ncbi:RNA-directed DNA polymerase (reverse transcriptase)-related family protein, partial [Striga hermonthica]
GNKPRPTPPQHNRATHPGPSNGRRDPKGKRKGPLHAPESPKGAKDTGKAGMVATDQTGKDAHPNHPKQLATVEHKAKTSGFIPRETLQSAFKANHSFFIVLSPEAEDENKPSTSDPHRSLDLPFLDDDGLLAEDLEHPDASTSGTFIHLVDDSTRDAVHFSVHSSSQDRSLEMRTAPDTVPPKGEEPTHLPSTELRSSAGHIASLQPHSVGEHPSAPPNGAFLHLIPEQTCRALLVLGPGNGSPTDFFPSSRGLRQGDPVSLSLFVLAVDYLSRCLDGFIRDYLQMTCSTRGYGPLILHLSNADVIIIFTQADDDGLIELMHLLEHYNSVIGQLISVQKSTFTFSSSSADRWAQRVHEITGFARNDLLITYLGAPLYKGHLTRALFADIRKRMIDRISNWSLRHLSFEGRLALIKSTLIFLHLLMVLDFSRSTLDEINQIMA